MGTELTVVLELTLVDFLVDTFLLDATLEVLTVGFETTVATGTLLTGGDSIVS